MKQIKYFSILLITFILGGCNPSFGEKYTLGNLEVYFTEDIQKSYVVDIADYFRDNDLILDQKHSILLTSDTRSFLLKMVLDDKYETLPDTQKKNVDLLEKDIRKVVFDNNNFKIVICNINFVPIDTPN